jgi:hypothetical protein
MRRDSDQALNIKEFAGWQAFPTPWRVSGFTLPGFPAILGKAFWGDFVLWRRTQNCPKSTCISAHTENGHRAEFRSNPPKTPSQWPARAASIASSRRLIETAIAQVRGGRSTWRGSEQRLTTALILLRPTSFDLEEVLSKTCVSCIFPALLRKSLTFNGSAYGNRTRLSLSQSSLAF